MANLPTVPQSDIEDAINKLNDHTLSVGVNTFQQLKINTGLLQSISETLLQGLALEETRQALEKQREGLLIEALREKRGDEGSALDDNKNKKISLKDLLGFDPNGLELALLAAALGAAAIALKTQLEEVATAIQGFVAFKLGTKAMDLFRGLCRMIL